MLGKLWRWLKRWLQRWRKSPRPEMARPQPAAPVCPAVTRPDAEYEALFLGLLDQLQPDWGYGQIQGWLLAHALKPAELAAWLERFGQRLLDSPEPNLPLAERLVQFSQIDRSELGRVGEVGRELLRRNVAVNSVENESVVVDENIVSQAEAFFNQGLEKAMAGDFTEAVALWDKAIEFKLDYHLAWYSRGVALSTLGCNEEALSNYEKAIELEPDFYEVWFSYGTALAALERNEEALSSYDKAIELKPDFPEAWFYRGLGLSDLGYKEEALSSYDKAIKLKPDNYAFWYNRGVILFALERIEEAIYSYDKSIEIKPSFPEALYNRGIAFSTLGFKDEAVASYDKAVGFKPDYYEVWYDRGIALFGLGYKEEALSSYNKALEIKSDFYMALNNQGYALHVLGRNEEALISYNCALELKPDTPLIWLNRGLALFSLGQNEEALLSCDRAIELKPNYTEAWHNRSAALLGLGREEEALESCDRAIELKPDLPEAWITQGAILSALGRDKEAIESCDKAIQLKPDLPEAWNNRSNALLGLSQNEAALESCDRAIQLKPDLPEAWSNQGAALSRLGRKEEAIASFDRAIQFKPNYYSVLSDRGLALADLDQNKQAIDSYDKALQINPDFPEAWFNRGISLSRLGRKEEAIDSYDRAIQIKPNYIEVWLNRGLDLCDLGREEEAIASYDKAIEIESDFYQAWANRASTICKLNQLKKLYPGLSLVEQNIDSCLIAETPHIAGLEAALPYVQSNPESWGRIHQVLGDAYFKHAEEQSDPRFYWRKAIQNYEIALDSLLGDSLLEPRLETFQKMLRASLALGDQDLTDRCCAEGSSVLQALLDTANSYRKRQISIKFARFNQLAVDSLVQAEKIDSALIAAECNKNRCLTRILDQWQEQVISPSYAEMRQLLRPQTAILYWHLSDDALTTFLLLPDQAQPQLLETDTGLLRQRQRQFSQWQTDWNRDYRDYRAKKDEATDPASAKANHIWRRELPRRLSRLREILGIAAIEQQLAGLAQGITQLILVPHRDLHRFPIHALFSQACTCTYLPSLQIGLSLQTRSLLNLPAASLLSIADPQSDRDEMVYAQIESAVIQQYFTQVTALPPQQATKANVSTALHQACDLFHFTGHGSHDDLNPQNSALGLADGETLTAQEISRLPLQTCYLASIAACETALTSRQSIDSEYVGLASAFLQAGTAHVLSTLWNVEEISSTWLMIQFYQQLLRGSLPAQALQQAKQWLSAVTPTELATWLTNLIALDPSSSVREYLHQEAERIRESITISSDQPNSNQPIYAHPYYWAAFTLTGTFTGTAHP